MRPLSNAAAALGRSRRPRPLSSAAPPFLLPARRLLASSSSSSAADGKEETHEDTDTNETAHFNVVAAEARSDPSRRFRVSTDGEKRQKVPVFRDLTRNRESFRERTMEHDTFVTNLPRALQQYEEEQEMARKQGGYARNPLVRDQATLVIDKDDASNRRWLSGAPEGAGQSSNWAEREVLAQRERLSGVEGTIMRRRAGLAGAMAGDSGLPDEGLSVEEKIQLAMAQGDFDNLKGKGEPLARYNGGGGSEGHYFEARTLHRFMETLHRAGVKPVWVDKAGRIKQMHALLRRRVEAEWARLLLEQASPTLPRTALPRLREQWRVRLECLKSLEEDLAFVNAEVDSYNLQVPSLALQRLRLRLDFLVEDNSPSSPSLPPFLQQQQQQQQQEESCSIDVKAAEACARAAERDGVLSPVTSLGGLRLEAEEDRARQETARREKKRWSRSDNCSSGTPPGGSGGVGGGLFGSIAAWITGGKG